MTEIIGCVGCGGHTVHVLILTSLEKYVLEDNEGRYITLTSDEMKDLAKIIRKYEEVDE